MIKLGLRIRFFLYSNTVIAVTMTLVTVFGMMYERRVRYESIVEHGRSVVEAMAIPISDASRPDDSGRRRADGLIENYIPEIMIRSRQEMRYVVVTDTAGTVTHSSHDQLVGSHFDRAFGGEPGKAITLTVDNISEEGEDLIEVRTPLINGDDFYGTLAVGFSLEPVERQAREVAKRAILVALVLMLGNSIMTALYVETLIRPILNLNETMKKAGEGNLTVRAPTRRGDEVAELADVFNRMMEELEVAREREELQRAQLAHTEKMAAVGTLAAGVAHEVNNPLAGVLASIENMRENPDDEEMRDRYLQLIADGLKRIERTVANLLNFARPREIKLEPTSINHNIRHVVELVAYQLRASGVEIEMDLDPGQAVVEADHFQMEQLFLNLVLNALDAMRDGGKLYLRSRVRGGKVIAEVRDTGHGIPADVRNHMFDPFFTTREVGEGTGLGLAVSGSIVAAHGGKIEVESSVGKGTTFRVIMAAMPGEWDGGKDLMKLCGHRLLIVEDEPLLRITMADALRKEGWAVDVAEDGVKGAALFEQHQHDLVLSDLVMPRLGGVDLLKRIKALSPHTTVVIITAHGTVDRAVEAMREGASDFIAKPFSMAQLVVRLSNVCSVRILKEQNVRLQAQLEQRHSFANIIGKSKPMQEVFDLIRLVGDSDASVIVHGESGTGKEMVASAIHFNSARRAKPYVRVSCASLPESLIESELFGYEKGAFTGASERRIGRFEAASGGTLFLDEIGELPLTFQVKLLRVLQERQIERLGSNRPIDVDVRIVSASVRSLEEEIRQNRFREDLYFRVNTVAIDLPPLRERHEDIPLLAEAFLQEFAADRRREIEGFNDEAIALFEAYMWPGNVRELRNVVERAVLFCRGPVITADELPPNLRGGSQQITVGELPPVVSMAEAVERAEVEAILAALASTRGRRSDAAELLGISRKTLWEKIKHLEIAVD